MTEAQLLKILAALSTEYNIEPKRETSYRFILIDEDYDIASEAVKRWIRTSKWPPRSAELLDLMEDIAYENRTPALPEPQRDQIGVDDARRMIGTLLKMGYTRAHPNLIAAAYGKPPVVHEKTSEPIPDDLKEPIGSEP